MTRLEVLAAVAILLILTCLFLPALFRPRSHYGRLPCTGMIKQVGLAMRMWANDHGDRFPWQVSLSATGTLEHAESSDVYRHFLALSNELSSPKVLTCPADAKIVRIAEWPKLSNRNLSYFVGLDADEVQPQSLLSGDRNILGGVWVTNSVMRFTNGSPAAWGPDLHKHQGNLGLGDGSAQQVTDSSLRKQIQSAYLGGGADVRLSIPKPN